MAQQEMRRKKDRLALDCVRLGKIVQTRTVSHVYAHVNVYAYGQEHMCVYVLSMFMYRELQ